jgi:hypothetical protein
MTRSTIPSGTMAARAATAVSQRVEQLPHLAHHEVGAANSRGPYAYRRVRLRHRHQRHFKWRAGCAPPGSFHHDRAPDVGVLGPGSAPALASTPIDQTLRHITARFYSLRGNQLIVPVSLWFDLTLKGIF